MFKKLYFFALVALSAAGCNNKESLWGIHLLPAAWQTLASAP